MLKRTALPVITQTLKLFNTEELHIEVSSKCTLKCPRCPRTELGPDAVNSEFSLAEFELAFPPELLTDVKRILFCGDMGDPIYATEFIDIVKYIKTTNAFLQLDIVTNGSYKKSDWWNELGGALTNRDTVTFSVDGWDHDSNNLYRVNSNFDSIIIGIKTLRSSSDCRIKWSTIYFNFNEHRIDDIKNLAKDLGCDEWQSVVSTKFNGRYAVNGVDPLIPSDPALSSDTGVYQTYPMVLNRPKLIKIKNQVNAHRWAKCLNWQKELFINVEGLLFPCPWFNSGYQENDFVQKYRDRLNVKTRGLDQVLNDPMWQEFITRLEVMPLEVCRIKCYECS